MEADPAKEVTKFSGGDAEDLHTTIEIKVKTMDDQRHAFCVKKSVPVAALKEQIATITGILSENQHLIFHGRVLKDDELLSRYHVEDGHTLHLVVRQPIQSLSSPSNFTGSEEPSTPPAADSSSRSAAYHGHYVHHHFLIGAMLITLEDLSTLNLNEAISSIISPSSTGNAGSRSTRTNSTEMEGFVRVSVDRGLSHSTQPQPISMLRPQPISTLREDPQQAAFRSPSRIPLGSQSTTVIPDSLSTMIQYLDLLRNEFRIEGGEHRNNSETAGLLGNDGQSLDFQSRAASGQGGLPGLTSLREIVLSTRQLLMEESGNFLSQLARRLGDHTNVSDPTIRMNIQSSTSRSGVLLQNLGSLLLELGRTIMTLHMGQTPSEAVVNPGPAVFISPCGPNPLLVQMGTVNSGHTPEGELLDSVFLPRSTDVQVQTSNMIPTAGTASSLEQADVQQLHNHAQQQPTVDSTLEESNSEDSARDGRHFRANSMPLDSELTLLENESDRNQGSTRVFMINHPRVFVSSNDSSTRAHDGQQTGHGPLLDSLNRFEWSQDSATSSAANHISLPGDSEVQDASRVNNDQGVFSSNSLRLLLPVISPDRAEELGDTQSNPSSTSAQTEQDSMTSSGPQHHHDPPKAPSSKRPRME